MKEENIFLQMKQAYQKEKRSSCHLRHHPLREGSFSIRNAYLPIQSPLAFRFKLNLPKFHSLAQANRLSCQHLILHYTLQLYLHYKSVALDPATHLSNPSFFKGLTPAHAPSHNRKASLTFPASIAAKPVMVDCGEQTTVVQKTQEQQTMGETKVVTFGKFCQTMEQIYLTQEARECLAETAQICSVIEQLTQNTFSPYFQYCLTHIFYEQMIKKSHEISSLLLFNQLFKLTHYSHGLAGSKLTPDEEALQKLHSGMLALRDYLIWANINYEVN